GDQRILLYCWSQNCKPQAIVKAIGLTMADLFPPQVNGKRDKARPRRVATYDYRDADGNLMYQVVRYEPKDFRQCRPDGNGGMVWNLKGVQRVPYRLPELLSAGLGEVVYIAEGEKDADALVRLGFVATTNAQGAGNWHTLDTAIVEQAFQDRHVVILPDYDTAGRAHATDVAQRLQGIAASIRVLEPPKLPLKGDVSDWIGPAG